MKRLTEIANLHTVDKGTEHYDIYIPETGVMNILSDKSYKNIEWAYNKKLLIIHK